MTTEFAGVGKRFGAVAALSDFTLRVADGEMVAVVGPSGCGKSTLLRLTAGLERPDSGEIRVDGRRIDELPPHRRDVAMVFQSYALYPHMSVRRNVEFPLRMRRIDRTDRRARVEAVAAALEITALLERRPAELSGGQRQRVALARAVVREPALFLLDEPLSNLDAQLRLGVRRYLHDLQRRLRVTTLYVTHDQTEAMTLGDRVVVLRDGRIQQIGTPAAVYEEPANTFVAGFFGTPPMNLLPARRDGGDLVVGGQRCPIPDDQRARLAALPERLVVGVRPESFSPAAGGAALVVSPDDTTREVLGSETLVRAAAGEHSVTVRFGGVWREIPARVSADWKALHLFSADAAGVRLG